MCVRFFCAPYSGYHTTKKKGGLEFCRYCLSLDYAVFPFFSLFFLDRDETRASSLARVNFLWYLCVDCCRAFGDSRDLALCRPGEIDVWWWEEVGATQRAKGEPIFSCTRDSQFITTDLPRQFDAAPTLDERRHMSIAAAENAGWVLNSFILVVAWSLIIVYILRENLRGVCPSEWNRSLWERRNRTLKNIEI